LTVYFVITKSDDLDETVGLNFEVKSDFELDTAVCDLSSRSDSRDATEDMLDPHNVPIDPTLPDNGPSQFSTEIPVSGFNPDDRVPLPTQDLPSATDVVHSLSPVNHRVPHVGASVPLWDRPQKTPESNAQGLSSPHVMEMSALESNFSMSPYYSAAFGIPPSLTLRWPVNNAYEARLFHHYIIQCTGWVDICDSRCHFAKEVPKRAAHFPVILKGILGLAARHLWLMGRVPEDLSSRYVDGCLQALIVALEDPLAHWDENFLVAVILLRLHEEMGDADEQCHHLGTARILNSISCFAADGGLRESASWVSLRQHIYVSLTTQQPLNLSLDNYRHSSVFRETDDESWANRIIFLFATILQTVFKDSDNVSSGGLPKATWTELHDQIEEWHLTKPWSFCALHVELNAGEKFEGRWPDLPCTQGVITVGLQYYHLCKTILTIYSPHQPLVGLAGVRMRKTTDALVRKHMRITIGYGQSNDYCTNAMFQVSHILSACGVYIVDPREQQACVEYLRGMQKMMGWRTDKVRADLEEQWST